jgi:hypothetical protein
MIERITFPKLPLNTLPSRALGQEDWPLVLVCLLFNRIDGVQQEDRGVKGH